MARDGFFTGLDIGTSSIKVLVAEVVNGVLNVIGVSNVKSAGVKDGIIVDIEAAARTIREAVSQAEEKAGTSIDRVSVSLPGNLLQIEPTQGMIPVTNEAKEIKDEDVENVVKSALTKSVMPDREIISLIPEEFIVDSFHGILDPRGMMGIRLEMKGWIYSGPSTMIHNLKRAVAKAGLDIEQLVISPLALTQSILNEGEREFGATIIDLGGGQTSVASMSGQHLHYTQVYSEGGDYITKDISKVLQTSLPMAEGLKYNFGGADVKAASLTETVQVDVVGANQPVEVTERYLAEIIAARLEQIFTRVKQDLERGRLLNLPGGLVLIGGGGVLPGITEFAQEFFGVNVKLYVPNQVGIRNPMFANVISTVEYVAGMSEVEVLAQTAVSGDEMLRQKPVDYTAETYRPAPVIPEPVPVETYDDDLAYTYDDDLYQEELVEPSQETATEPKKKMGDRVRGLFGSLFD